METQELFLPLPDHDMDMHTAYIQAALDKCREGGGVLRLAPGDWHIASLRLYDNTTLYLSSGTHLIASNRWQDYTNFHVPTTLGYLKSPFLQKEWRLPDHYVNSPITAIDAENVAVIGEHGSWIDGSDCLDPKGEEGFRGPMGMVFCRCRGVTLRGYTYRNAANWCHQLDSCIQVRMDHVTVLGGHDGINLHHCTQVWIDSCDFRTGDDCIAGYDAENVVVRNCSLNTSCNSFRFGGRNLLVEHCRFWGPGEYPHRSSGRHNTLFAFAYYAFHYDLCRWDSENWVVRNCTFEHLDNLIYYNYGGDWNHNARPLRDLTLEHITIRGLAGTSHITTLPESPITVTCKDLSLSWRNGLPQTGVLRTSPAVRLVLEDVRVEGVNQSPAQ